MTRKHFLFCFTCFLWGWFLADLFGWWGLLITIPTTWFASGYLVNHGYLD
jgi:hypothetical protein